MNVSENPTIEGIAELLRIYCEERYPGLLVEGLTVELSNGRRIELPMGAAYYAAAHRSAARPDEPLRQLGGPSDPAAPLGIGTPATPRGPLDLTDAEREVAAVLFTLARGAGLTAKQVASRLRMDQESVAMRLRRMRRRGLVERVAGIGFRLTAAGRAAITDERIADQLGDRAGDPRSRRARHGPDFRSVNWFGEHHVFNGNQAAVVKVLWDAWENETPEVGIETLREASGSSADDFRSIFRDHDAWGSMIVSPRRGVCRLAERNDEQDPA